MTPITAFVALPARREPRFRCRIAAMLAGIPVKERVRICNDGTADSRRRRACQDLETGAELRRFESLPRSVKWVREILYSMPTNGPACLRVARCNAVKLGRT